MFSFGRKLSVVGSTSAVIEKTPEEKMLERLFEITEHNKQKIGEKVYADIPVELLAIDESYQRTETYNKEKVKDLIANFDVRKMDTLLVSVHEDEHMYYIIDGMHRLLAAIAKGIKHINCEIQFFDGDPETRRKAEARRFIEQQEGIDKMSPLDQHKGHVVCEDEEYVHLHEVVENTDGIQFKTNKNRGRQPKGTITGYKEAMRTTKWYGKEHIQNVFDALIGAKWNEVGTGLGDTSICMVSNVLAAHPEEKEKVKAEIARVLINWEPKLFRGVAQGHYPFRSERNASILLLEDYVCTNLNIPRLIDKETVKERFNPVA